MITLLGSYAELLSKLDKDEQIKHITKTAKLIKKESKMYQEKYIDTIKTIEKLRNIKSKIQNGDTNIMNIYTISEEDSEYEEIGITNKQQ